MLPLKLKMLEIGFVIFIAFMTGWVIHGWKIDSAYKNQYMNELKQIKNQQTTISTIDASYTNAKMQYSKDILNLKENQSATLKSSEYGTCNVPTSGVQFLNTTVTKTNSLVAPG